MPDVKSRMPDDWAKAALKIQRIAGLKEWNHNWVNSWDVSIACKNRKLAIVKLLEENNRKLCVYFGQADRPISDVKVGRSMYENNKLYIETAERHLVFIEESLAYEATLEVQDDINV